MRSGIKKFFSLGLSIICGLPVVALASCKDNEVEDGKVDSRYKIVYCGDINGYEGILISQFAEQIEDRYNVEIDTVPDSVEQGDYEILIGYTNRSESASLYETFKENKGNKGFAVKTSISKIYLVGSDLTQTYLALDYALENVFVNGEDGDIAFTKSRMEYVSDGTDIVFDVKELTQSGRGAQFVAEELCAYIPAVGAHSVMQGAGTDGTYAYFANIDKTDSVQEAVVYKYDLSTWTLVKTSQSLPIGHANDIAYDAKNHRLLITTCSTGDPQYHNLAIIDPDTLELVDAINLGTLGFSGVYKIEYLASSNRFLIGGSKVWVADENFSVIQAFNDPYNSKGTNQNFWTDEKYIYDLKFTSYGDIGVPGYVAIYDFNGNALGYIPLYGLKKCEPEAIFAVDGNFYIANGLATITSGIRMCSNCYKIELIPNLWW